MLRLEGIRRDFLSRRIGGIIVLLVFLGRFILMVWLELRGLGFGMVVGRIVVMFWSIFIRLVEVLLGRYFSSLRLLVLFRRFWVREELLF